MSMNRIITLALASAAALSLAPASSTPTRVTVLSNDPTTPPDRLSVDKSSPYFDECYRRVEVLLDGKVLPGNVEEYCVSEGWVLLRSRNPRGQWEVDKATGMFKLTRRTGVVEPRFLAERRPPRKPSPARHDPEPFLRAAADKRARKAAKRALLAGHKGR